MNAYEDQDTDYNSLEQARKYYELIADIKTSIGKLDMLQLYINSKYADDVVLTTSVNNIIAEINTALGENNYKTIEIPVQNQTNVKTNIEIVEEVKPSKSLYIRKLLPIGYKKTNKKTNKISPKGNKKVDNPENVVKDVLESVSKVKCLEPKNYCKIHKHFPENSTNILVCTYYELDKELDITFKGNGRTYRYFNVSMTEYANIINAKSIGRYVQANIVKVYENEEKTEEMVG